MPTVIVSVQAKHDALRGRHKCLFGPVIPASPFLRGKGQLYGCLTSQAEKKVSLYIGSFSSVFPEKNRKKGGFRGIFQNFFILLYSFLQKYFIDYKKFKTKHKNIFYILMIFYLKKSPGDAFDSSSRQILPVRVSRLKTRRRTTPPRSLRHRRTGSPCRRPGSNSFSRARS